VYQLSRSLYRELAPMLPSSDGASDSERRDARQYLVEACERVVRRLVFEPDACANPARTLFRDVRHLFAIDAQADALRVVTFHIDAGRILAERMQETLKRDCQAITRNGSPCRREPPPGKRFCPSHYALGESLSVGAEGLPEREPARVAS
jgi:hypothetical protein